MGDHMKNIEEILKCKKISDIEFYLDYYELIEELFKNKTAPPKSFYEEKGLIEERLEELCTKAENNKNSICNIRFNAMKRL